MNLTASPLAELPGSGGGGGGAGGGFRPPAGPPGAGSGCLLAPPRGAGAWVLLAGGGGGGGAGRRIFQASGPRLGVLGIWLPCHLGEGKFLGFGALFGAGGV